MRFADAPLRTGVRVHFAEHGDASSAPIVFLHGWPDSWFSFSRVPPLLPKTLRAIAFDQRGFGESDHPESGYTLPELAADAVALLDALKVYEETGHCPNWERPGDVAADIAGFTLR